MMSILGDEYKKYQFSKTLVFISVLFSLVGIIGIVLISILLDIDSSVLVTASGALGTICVTSLVWSLKKSQAENTAKIYISVYKEIDTIKRRNSPEEANEFLTQAEQSITCQLLSNIDNSMSDATSLIERQFIQ